MSRDISYLVGSMFHGTRVGDARLISGLRPDGRKPEEPVHRTSFNVGGTPETNYPKRFGPGMYLTDTKHDAKGYADIFKPNSPGGAVIEGKVTPDSPVHLTEDEFDDIGTANSSQNLIRRLQARDPKFFLPIVRPRKASFSEILAVNRTKNFNEMPDVFKTKYNPRDYDEEDYDENFHPKLPFINNNTLITGAHRAAVNLQLREGHDYLHITSHDPLYDDKDSQYGIVLRPNIKGKPPIFKPRAVHFFDGLESAARTEELK